MLLGYCVLMIWVEQQGGVGDRGIGQLQHSLLGSMMLYKGAAANVVGVRIGFLLVRGRSSCGMIVGAPGGQIRRVCGKLLGWGHIWVVCGRDKRITDGGGCSGWFGA